MCAPRTREELVAALTPEPLIVEAAWSASRAPGPLRAFYRRIATRRGFQVAVVARARGMTVLFWHLITKDQDYAFARPGLNAHKGPHRASRDGRQGIDTSIATARGPAPVGS